MSTLPQSLRQEILGLGLGTEEQVFQGIPGKSTELLANPGQTLHSLDMCVFPVIVKEEKWLHL